MKEGKQPLDDETINLEGGYEKGRQPPRAESVQFGGGGTCKSSERQGHSMGEEKRSKVPQTPAEHNPVTCGGRRLG